MYGLIVKNHLEVGDASIIVERFENHLKYRRSMKGDVKEVLLDRNAVVETRPIYSLFYPSYVTGYTLVSFSKPVVLSPKSSMRIQLQLPVDLAIYAYSGDFYRMIDLIPLHSNYKYALYGPVISSVEATGYIARLVKGEPIAENTAEPLEKHCLTRVLIVNKTQDFASVSKILLDAKPLKIFYVPETWKCYTQDIKMVINSRDHASILYEEKPCMDCVELEEPEEFRGMLRALSTEMLWGY
uniref:DUF432 domain-containing protein n=1 Tax=Thermosphaera aggregans TaxID=54254 RepID=A0A7C2G171_9CREN